MSSLYRWKDGSPEGGSAILVVTQEVGHGQCVHQSSSRASPNPPHSSYNSCRYFPQCPLHLAIPVFLGCLLYSKHSANKSVLPALSDFIVIPVWQIKKLSCTVPLLFSGREGTWIQVWVQSARLLWVISYCKSLAILRRHHAVPIL